MRIIHLSNGGQTLVDDKNYDWLTRYSWSAYRNRKNGQKYVIRQLRKNGKCKTFWMHREILKAPDGLFVDHADGDGFNNLESNLRVCTHSQNMMNRKKPRGPYSSKFKGVSRGKGETRWRAMIRVNGKMFELGRFEKEEDGALAYDVAAQLLCGEFARLNGV